MRPNITIDVAGAVAGHVPGDEHEDAALGRQPDLLCHTIIVLSYTLATQYTPCHLVCYSSDLLSPSDSSFATADSLTAHGSRALRCMKNERRLHARRIDGNDFHAYNSCLSHALLHGLCIVLVACTHGLSGYVFGVLDTLGPTSSTCIRPIRSQLLQEVKDSHDQGKGQRPRAYSTVSSIRRSVPKAIDLTGNPPHF
jgi:hypothetical protein